jgi:hypothetical protein
MQTDRFDLLLAGGMFRANTPYLVDGLEAVVRTVAPNVRLQPLADPPVVGAVLMEPGLRRRLADGIATALGHHS